MSEQPGGEIILYQRDNAPAIDVRLDGDTVWLSQQQLADLFQTSRTNVVEHIANIYAEGELSQEATCREFRQVRTEGTREVARTLPFYNLDLIISLGYRVRSRIATSFRIWATERLREYLVKGFTMDDARLKNLGGGSYWKELLERIRDIRSSERVLYRQVLDLYATSVDYDPKAEASVIFFKTVQNKLHYAAHGQTAAEVVAARADAGKPFMGLLSFSGNQPTKADVAVAKNYLDADELKRLNTLVSAYFDAAEFRAMNHEPTYMKDWLAHLEQLIVAMGGKTLQGAGHIGLVFAAQALANALSRIPFGRLSDRIADRGTLVIGGLAGLAAALGLAGLCTSLPGLLGCAALLGVSMGVAFTALAALIADVVPHELRGMAMGGYNSCIYLGMMTSAARMGALISRFGFAPGFLVAGAVTIATTLVFRTFYRRTASAPA